MKSQEKLSSMFIVPTSPDLDSESRSPESACERDSIWKCNRIGLAATSCERLSPAKTAPSRPGQNFFTCGNSPARRC